MFNIYLEQCIVNHLQRLRNNVTVGFTSLLQIYSAISCLFNVLQLTIFCNDRSNKLPVTH